MGLIKKILIVLVLIFAAFAVFISMGNYSSGTQAGVVMKISEKGVLMKTWEGRLDMGTIGKHTNNELGSKIFEFSIDGDKKELIEKLQEAQLSGRRANLYFDQKYIALPWSGETKFFATRIDVQKGSTNTSNSMTIEEKQNDTMILKRGK